jgi:hypothetical protein
MGEINTYPHILWELLGIIYSDLSLYILLAVKEVN